MALSLECDVDSSRGVLCIDRMTFPEGTSTAQQICQLNIPVSTPVTARPHDGIDGRELSRVFF